MDKPNRSTYTPMDFLQWKGTDSLSLTPKFQRRGVWKRAARSFFVDTLLRGMPVPPVYIRTVQSPDRKRVIREVIDGQQRIAAVLDFVEGKYALAKSLGGTWAGKHFAKLGAEDQDKITGYGFSSEVFQSISDLEVLEIFSRLNTYSVKLNAQELRNGAYFGPFKRTMYALALEHLEFWRRHRIFSEQNIARMLEVEFTSEVVVAQIVGMQDKKKSLDHYYDVFDETFPGQAQAERRFRSVADAINSAFPDGLGQTEFRRSPLLYTLFCVIYHRIYGLDEIAIATPKRALNADELGSLRDAVGNLSEKIAAGRARQPIPKAYEKFVAACLSQTDNIKPRLDRFTFLHREAFGK
jgi:hypothetical protein